jgi:hypothetical protein
MKNQLSNIALEGTCSGDVVGGLLSWTGVGAKRQKCPRREMRPPGAIERSNYEGNFPTKTPIM